ncbi:MULTISPECIES: hypothetical protein [Pseudomonas syringae group]|uniref:Uncharacterized protein n=2 Tax=Pseudomonas syringae group TaxID=136849 RepID=A0A0P9N7B8_PSESX|nr:MULTISPECIES: hypothetical protein [Pseudomonas syringae group]KPW93323.1 hypothetical protein ALO79_200319 [Pseudomonas syringae pv. castaneae]RMS96916.1 hypothetical protein ALP58_200127 [Pseudomonas savastanoi]
MITENVLISKLSSDWSEHLESRISDAVEIGMIDESGYLELAAATVLLPKLAADNQDKIRPETSVRSAVGDKPVAGQWIKRPDLMCYASSVISKLYGGASSYIICEAGYSKNGDKFLTRFEGFSHEGSPFIHVKITGDNLSEVEAILKTARSFRLLGLITDCDRSPTDFGGHKIAFLCDALDGDSIIICSKK